MKNVKIFVKTRLDFIACYEAIVSFGLIGDRKDQLISRLNYDGKLKTGSSKCGAQPMFRMFVMTAHSQMPWLILFAVMLSFS